MDEPKVTTGFKVPISLKREIDRTAKGLGMDTSNYLRGLVLGRHGKLATLSDYPDTLVLEGDGQREALSLLAALSEKYPDYEPGELLVAALGLALKLEGKWGSYKLKDVL